MNREQCAHDLVRILPYIFKKFRNVYKAADIPRQQLQLLFYIRASNGQPTSHYVESLRVPKSNVSVAANQLVEKGLVQRVASQEDRRVSILEITDKGLEYLDIYMHQVDEAMLESLSELKDLDIQRLVSLMDDLKSILDQIYLK